MNVRLLVLKLGRFRANREDLGALHLLLSSPQIDLSPPTSESSTNPFPAHLRLDNAILSQREDVLNHRLAAPVNLQGISYSYVSLL